MYTEGCQKNPIFKAYKHSLLEFPDRSILMFTTGMAALATLVSVGFEMVFKSYHNLSHIGGLAVFLYLGAEEKDLNPDPWFIYCTLPYICLYALSLSVYRIVKYRKNR